MSKPARKPLRVKVKANEAANFNKLYERSYAWKEGQPTSVRDVRTTCEMMAFLQSDAGKDVQLDARVIAHNRESGEFGTRKLTAKQFIESFKANDKSRRTFRETFSGYSDFARGGIAGGFANTVGQDFTPLLGGPFYKQLYYYNDWLKMHQDCFYAYHHDPYGKATVNILIDFTLGKGFDVQFESPVMQALWDAFEIANGFQELFRNYAKELSAYGENMLWCLPDNERYITYPRNEITLADVPKTFIPRIRILDPSNIVEIITYPEDITRRLAYVWMTPTQYQTFTAKDEATGKVVSGTKLIYQQIPAHQIFHHTINAVSNEKRGRSDLFCALPYFKRLRDSVNYEIIAQQKNAAWAIDTTIDGEDSDLQAYMDAQASLGTIPNAGSEFVHTKAVSRQYLGNQGAAKGISTAFEWCLSMIAASTGIPISYYGTHLSGGSTRASAIVATEPVAKRFEMRQEVYKKIIGDVATWLMNYFGIKSEFEVNFPEIITQDRSAKLKDLYLAEQAKWFKPERCAQIAAMEFGQKDYDWEAETAEIDAQQKYEVPPTPLTQPALDASKGPGGVPTGQPSGSGPTSDSAVTGSEKKAVKDSGGF